MQQPIAKRAAEFENFERNDLSQNGYGKAECEAAMTYDMPPCATDLGKKSTTPATDDNIKIARHSEAKDSSHLN